MPKPSSPRRSRAPAREGSEFEEEVIQIDRVTRVVKGGRRLRFRATVVIGNRKGKVGVGIGKSVEVQGAIKKAVAQAKKSLIEVPIIGGTIPHRVNMKFKSAKMIIMPACPGTGIIAGGPLRKILELAGVKDVLSKVLGCKNRLSNSQAGIMALMELRTFPWLKKVAPVQPATPAKVETAPGVKPLAPAAKPVAQSTKPATKPVTSTVKPATPGTVTAKPVSAEKKPAPVVKKTN